LVTGATGFVGSHVARVLQEGGFQVRAMARKRTNTLPVEQTGLEVVWGDLTDPASLREALRGCQGLFHVAALNSFWSRDPGLFYRTNVEGTRNILTSALEAGVQRVVYTSTWAVIGAPPRGGLATEATAPRPGELKGHYRWSKHLAEREALTFVERGLDVVVVNPTVVVGWGDVKPTPSGRLVLDFLRGRIPAYIDAYLNLIDVEDVAQGHLLAWRQGKRGERYILGNQNMTLLEVLETLAAITGLRAPHLRAPVGLALAAAYADHLVEGRLLHREPRIPLEGVMHAWHYRAVDCSKARQALGLPQTPVEAALEKAVRWFRETWKPGRS
jgi:dihydroflavonol-4-reductase